MFETTEARKIAPFSQLTRSVEINAGGTGLDSLPDVLRL